MREHDEAAIRDVAGQWEEAWNRHDMAAMATLLTTDADFVNVAASHWKGRERIEYEHAQRHRTQFRESVWTAEDVAIQFLTADLALVHMKWGITGARDPDDTPRKPRTGVFSWLMARNEGAWRIRAAQNTNLIISPTWRTKGIVRRQFELLSAGDVKGAA